MWELHNKLEAVLIHYYLTTLTSLLTIIITHRYLSHCLDVTLDILEVGL